MEALGDALGIEVRVRQMSAHIGQCLATAKGVGSVDARSCRGKQVDERCAQGGCLRLESVRSDRITGLAPREALEEGCDCAHRAITVEGLRQEVVAAARADASECVVSGEFEHYLFVVVPGSQSEGTCAVVDHERARGCECCAPGLFDEQGSAGLEQEVKVLLLIVGLGDVAAGAPDLLGPGPFGGQAEVGVLAQSDLPAESGTDGIGPN